jgi:hypothetical protein
LRDWIKKYHHYYIAWRIAGSIVWIAIVILAVFAIVLGFDPPLPTDKETEVKKFTTLLRSIFGNWQNILIFALTLSTIFFSVAQWRTNRKAGKFKDSGPVISKSLRKFSFDYIKTHRTLLAAATAAKQNEADFHFQNSQELTALCSSVAQLFEELSGEDCHCTLKVFNPKTGEISTKARDDLNHNHDRRRIDEWRSVFSYRLDTGFTSVLENADCLMFLCNDIKGTYPNGNYLNANPDWQKYFNSTIIFPLSAQQSSQGVSKDTCFGFITIDSLKGNFNKDLCESLMSFYALHFREISDIIARQGVAKLQSAQMQVINQ